MRPAFLVLLVSLAGPAWAQHAHSPYAALQGREIKALSPEQVADLREGRGMGASLPAELNGVPGPLHALQLADRLQVSPQQRAALESIEAAMKAAAQELGIRVIDAERELDHAFRKGTADEAGIRQMSARIGALNAELRAVHLVAHLRTRQVLSDRQVAAYNEARGYAPASSATGGGHRHRH